MAATAARHNVDPAAPGAPGHLATAKKAKDKKAADPANTSKAIEDTIAQLERSRAGDREAEIELEREVKRANRDLSNLLSKLETPLTRIDILQRKYTEMFTEMKKTERELIKSRKRADQLQKEKDSSRSELSKMTIVKDKLEKLCRELQKENKKLKDDNKRLTDTERDMREELHARLESMVVEVQGFIDLKEHPENQPAHMETDELFRQKFKSFLDQFELRELQFHALLRTKELEVQYQVARFEQQRRAQEQEASKSKQLTSQVSTFSQTETELRSQLNVYVEKFKQVEDTLNNSNDLFLTFRKEMEEMSKKTKRLEKENHTLTRKHDLTNHNILQMAEERTSAHKELDMLRRKNANLEKLCRGMQQQGRGQAAVEGIEGADGEGALALEGELESEGTLSDYEEYSDEDAPYDPANKARPRAAAAAPAAAAVPAKVAAGRAVGGGPAGGLPGGLSGGLPGSLPGATKAGARPANGQANGIRH